MEKRVCMVTGANRGIGLEFTRQLLREGSRVIATCRSSRSETSLVELKKHYPDALEVRYLELTDPQHIEKLFQSLDASSERIDLLIHNAGILIEEKTLEVSPRGMIDQFHVNAVAPMLVSRAAIPLLKRSTQPKLVVISSNAAQITTISQGSDKCSYGMSKAALNKGIRHLAYAVKDDGIPVMLIHPGWVQTEMGGKWAKVTAEDSVSGMLRLIADLTLEQTGTFYTYDGTVCPW